MGEIASAIAEFKQPRPGYECSMCRALRMVTPEDRAAIEAEFGKEISDPSRIPDGRLARILTDAGFPMQRITVLRHRRGECVRR